MSETGSASGTATVSASVAGVSTTPDTPDTPLSEALPEIGLDQYVNAFKSKGYLKWSDLTDDAETAKAGIWSIPDMQDGERNRALAAYKLAMEPPKTAPVPPIAQLPAGAEFDLTQPTVTFDNVEYEIPAAVGMVGDGKAPVHASQLTPAQWLTLARNNNLTVGYFLDRIVGDTVANADAQQSTTTDDCVADCVVFDWKVPEGGRVADWSDPPKYDSSLGYTSASSSMAANRAIGVSVDIQAPYVSGSASVDRDEKQAAAADLKNVRMTGYWYQPRAKIHVDQCTVLSPAFTTEISNALNGIPPGKEPGSSGSPKVTPFEALQQVFARYGNVYAQRVTVGGELYFVYTRQMKGTVNTDQVKLTVKAAATVKATSSIGGGASASFDDGLGHTVAASDISEKTEFVAIGGDRRLVQKPDDWLTSINQPDEWEVIKRGGLAPIVDRLDSTTQANVKSVWQTGLKILWGGHEPPAGYVNPDMQGKPFTIADFEGLSAASTLQFDTGIPVPVAADPNFLANPSAHGLLWRLYYTGTTSDQNQGGYPLYWIAAYDPKREPSGITMDDAGLTALQTWLTTQEQNAVKNGKTKAQVAQALITSGSVAKFTEWEAQYATGAFLSARESTDGGQYIEAAMDFVFQSWLPTEAPETSASAWQLIPADPGGNHPWTTPAMYLLYNQQYGFLQHAKTLGMAPCPQTPPAKLKLQDMQEMSSVDFERYCWTCRPVKKL